MKVTARHYDEGVEEGCPMGEVPPGDLDAFLGRAIGAQIFDSGSREIMGWQFVTDRGEATLELIYGDEL